MTDVPPTNDQDHEATGADRPWSSRQPPPPTSGWGAGERSEDQAGEQSGDEEGAPRSRPPVIWGPDSGPTPQPFGPSLPPPAPTGHRGLDRRRRMAWEASQKSAWQQLAPAAALCLTVVLAAAALVVYASMRDSNDYPDHWDPRVSSLVSFVERTRGLSFQHPVQVDFLTPTQYSDAVRTEQGDLTDEQTDSLDRQASFLRALGLAAGKIDMAQASNDMADAGTLAFYDLQSKHVVVRGRTLGVDLRVTLAHELTHALQDQWFDLDKLQVDLDLDRDHPDQDVIGGYQALVEGDAVRVENAYVRGLPKAELDRYIASYKQQVSDARTKMGDVPASLQASMAVPYVLGEPLVELVAADGGNDAVDDAFDHLPSTSEQMLDPRAYFDHQGPGRLDRPKPPEGAHRTDQGTLGAVDVYLMLAERVDPLVALRAADGWGNGRYVTFDQADRTCVRFSVALDSAADRQQLRGALQQWVAAAPPQASAHIVGSSRDDAVAAQSCDPGVNGPAVRDRSLDTLQLPTMRSQFMVEAVQYGHRNVDQAWSEANCVIDRLGYGTTLTVAKATAQDQLPPSVEPAIKACAGSTG